HWLLWIAFALTASHWLSSLSLHDALPICNDDLDTMESIARAYIIAQTWVATKLVEIRETNPPAPDWDKELVALYQSALHSGVSRSEEHTSELQSRFDVVCRLLLEKKKGEL